jgi:hypothetical protein
MENNMDRNILTRPFPPELVKQRPGRNGKQLRYIETHAVIARLSEGCDSWSFEVIEHQVLDAEVIVLGRLTADGVVKCAFGGSTITRERSGEVISIADDLKSAASDALKKCSTLLSIGLELYAGAAAHQQERPKTLASVPIDHRVTTRQLSALQSASRRRGIGQDGLVALVRERAGKETITALTKGEASSLISELTGTNGGGR